MRHLTLMMYPMMVQMVANQTTISPNFTEVPLDEVLAAVNKSDENTPTAFPPTTTFGARAFMHAINNNYKKEDLVGATLRIVVPQIEPPYVNYVNFSVEEEQRRGYGPGVVMEILREVKEQLNLTYIIIDSDDHSWGAYENGNWTGAFGMLYRGECDIIAGGAIMQYDRSLITDLTYPFQYAPTALLIRAPEKFNDNTWLIVTQPFKWEVWGLTFISIAVSGITFRILTLFLTRANEIQFSFVDSLWVFFSVFVQQGLPQQPRSWTCRVMLALWWLASITLMATFTGSLVALFAVDKISLPFNNLEQLVKLMQKGKWRIIMDSNSLTRTNMIKNSELAVYKTLWYEMTVNRRVIYVSGVDSGIALLKSQENLVLLGPEDTLAFHATIDCQLTKLDEGILPTYLSIPVSKGSPYSTFMSNTIRDLVERGFVEKWIRDYTAYMATTSSLRCNTTNASAEKYLDLSKAQGAFWVLIAGFALAILFLAIEFGYRQLRQAWFSCSGR